MTMELSQLLEAMQELTAPDYVVERSPARGVRLEIPERVYDAAGAVVRNLTAADLLNHKKAQAAFPKLLRAVQLILVLNEQDIGPDAVKLTPKTRGQLRDAVRAAGAS